VAAFFVLRASGPGELGAPLWTSATVLLTLLSPVAGLTILAAIGPFTEAVTADGGITPAPVLLATLGVSVAARLLLTRRLPRLSWPVALALVMLAGTALGVVHTWFVFGLVRGTAAAQLWVPGLGSAMTMLVVAAWIGWRGETRPLMVAVVCVVAAALSSLLDFFSRGGVQATPIGSLLVAERRLVAPGWGHPGTERRSGHLRGRLRSLSSDRCRRSPARCPGRCFAGRRGHLCRPGADLQPIGAVGRGRRVCRRCLDALAQGGSACRHRSTMCRRAVAGGRSGTGSPGSG
jgi:hypothetical protein